MGNQPVSVVNKENITPTNGKEIGKMEEGKHSMDKSKNIKISAFHIFKVFVANPHKPREIIEVLAKNHGELLMLLNNLPTSNGGEDEQLEEEKDLIIKEIERISRLLSVPSP